jgi:hypothetical protein
MSKGILQMRVSVMEFGRFTCKAWPGSRHAFKLSPSGWREAIITTGAAYTGKQTKTRTTSGPSIYSHVHPGVTLAVRGSHMNCERSLIAAVVFLALGLGLIFGFTHGTIGLSAAVPVAGAALQLSIKTTGLPAVLGVTSTLVGLLLLIVALVQAVVAQVRWPGEGTKRQMSPAA